MTKDDSVELLVHRLRQALKFHLNVQVSWKVAQILTDECLAGLKVTQDDRS